MMDLLPKEEQSIFQVTLKLGLLALSLRITMLKLMEVLSMLQVSTI